MRTISTLILTIFFACIFVQVQAQNDTMYLYKGGAIILQKAIADVDSITFAKKATEKTFAVYDIDGNGYDTVRIGHQTWMVQNFRATHFRTGVAVPHVTDSALWNNATTAMYCWYNDDSAANAVPYGALYNWYAASDLNNLAPAGWHVAKWADFDTLIVQYTAAPPLSRGAVCGQALRETGTEHWNTEIAGTTNSTGWTAVGAGMRDPTLGNSYGYQMDLTMWWCNDPGEAADPTKVLTGYMDDWGSGSMTNNDTPKKCGISIRMVKDN
jgi:uncharacterized protein (TIGR02145 family)